MSAWRSEKLRTRSGRRSRIFPRFAEVKGRNPRLVAARLGRTHAMPGDADDAVLLAEQIKGFDSLVGKADDPLRWKHSRGLTLFCRDCRLLTDDQPLDHAPHVHSVGVGGDVDEALFAELVEAPLLRFDHFLILEKRRRDLAIELLRRLGIVLPVAIRRRPEVEQLVSVSGVRPWNSRNWKRKSRCGLSVAVPASVAPVHCKIVFGATIIRPRDNLTE